MNIAFEKYHGTGNDFILIDIRNHAIQDKPDIIAQLCDRNYGIGADGLITLGHSSEQDFIMTYYNSDGKKSSMCGNGGRCIVAYANKLGIIKDKAKFIGPDGMHEAFILSKNSKRWDIRLQMSDIPLAEWGDEGIFLDTGSPHFVIETDDLAGLDVNTAGRRIRHRNDFQPGGTNVDFIKESDGILHVRTYERGVENETLSCGTGVTASALAWSIKNGASSPVKVQTPGGMLEVHFNRDKDIFKGVCIEGPAIHVFSGNIEI